MLQVIVLGSGCKNCHTVQERVQQTVDEMGIEAKVELVTDLQVMMQYGVMQTPAIVMNDKLVSTGRVPAPSQIKTMVSAAVARSG